MCSSKPKIIQKQDVPAVPVTLVPQATTKQAAATTVGQTKKRGSQGKQGLKIPTGTGLNM